jgi:hypothetical protein
MLPLIRPSRPITTFGELLFLLNSQLPYAAVNFTISSGVKLFAVLPPIVPRIPDMLLINATILRKVYVRK